MRSARLLIFILTFLALESGAQEFVQSYPLPDSIRAVQFLAEINVQSIPARKEAVAGIRTDVVTLALECEKGKKELVFEFPAGSRVMAKGQGVDADKDELEWDYDWNLNENYKLLLSVATDSAENFSLYSGYIWLPKEAQWKLLGTCKIAGRWSGIKEPAIFYSNGSKNNVRANVVATWVQRGNGSWKNLQNENLPNPIALVSNHVDSLAQWNQEKTRIEKSMNDGKIVRMDQVGGLYYQLLKEGTGPAVSVNDTVVAFYKGYLFEDGLVFDQTKEKPATFPLNRLIKGWQLGVPMCKVGGKIKLVIPSALAYSVRTRAAKIPPNSILVFEIEVVSVKPPM